MTEKMIDFHTAEMILTCLYKLNNPVSENNNKEGHNAVIGLYQSSSIPN